MGIKFRPSKKVIIGAVAATLLIIGIGGSGSNNNSVQPQPSPQAQQGQVQGTSTQKQQTAQPAETKTITEVESIPYQSTTRQDPTLDSGQQKVTTAGVNGEKTITYQVTYTDGKETSRVKIGEQTTKQPIDQITSIGTKTAALSCPNGTYVNSSGNTVCRPYASDTVPAGAHAKCNDGSYSFSQNRKGTCSGHGGVAVWYY